MVPVSGQRAHPAVNLMRPQAASEQLVLLLPAPLYVVHGGALLATLGSSALWDSHRTFLRKPCCPEAARATSIELQKSCGVPFGS